MEEKGKGTEPKNMTLTRLLVDEGLLFFRKDLHNQKKMEEKNIKSLMS